MAKFEFRLQSVLRLAISQLNERRRELADAQEAAQVLADRRDELAAEHHDVRNTRTKASIGENVRVERLLDASRYELVLIAQLSGLAKQQAEVEKKLEQRRQHLVEADRHVRTLEKLRDRKLAEYTLEYERSQQRRIDEVATQQYTYQTRLARDGSDVHAMIENGD